MAGSTKVAQLPTSITSGGFEVEAHTSCMVSLAIKLEHCRMDPEAIEAAVHFMDNFVNGLKHFFMMGITEGRRDEKAIFLK